MKRSIRWCSTSSTASPPPLTQQHANFLKLVGGHGGDGEVRVQRVTVAPAREAALLTLRHDRARNALSGRMMLQLAEAVDGLLAAGLPSPPIGLILRGHGDAFCAGADLSLAREVLTTSALGLQMSAFMTDLLTRLRRSRMVSVALLTGPAVGGGAELCTATDYRLMVDAPHAHVCFVHARLGASPGWGGATRLVRLVGRAHALTLLGTSERVSPARAQAIGLVDQVLPDTSSVSSSSSSSSSAVSDASPALDAATEAAIAFLRPFAAQPYPDALGDIKETVAAAEYCDPGQAGDWEKRAFGRRWGSDANKDALTPAGR